MPDRRDTVVAFRLTAQEAAHIDAAGAALRHPRARADYARAATLHLARRQVPAPSKPIRRPARRRPALDTRVLGQILAQVGKIGSNLNQLAKVANSTQALPTVPTLSAITREVTAIRSALTTALTGADDGNGAT